MEDVSFGEAFTAAVYGGLGYAAGSNSLSKGFAVSALLGLGNIVGQLIKYKVFKAEPRR